MDGIPQEHGDERPPGNSRLWLLPLAALIAWQGWMTLTLFGPDHPWDNLLDDRPVVSGRHPLHLYHGYLGARSFLQDCSLSSYDPSFQAGYPKTPVFDSGSRPAELFLTLAGGGFNPAAYKIGLAACCLLAPFALILAASGIGLNRRATTLATALGLLVWWAGPCRRAVEDGDLDLLLSSLAAVALSGLLVRFHRSPGVVCWLALTLVGFLGWFAAPLFFALLLPLFLIWYLSVGTRHRLTWSLSLLAGLVMALVCNWFWLDDWIRYLWLRMPLSGAEALLPHRTPANVWCSALWGDPFDRWLEIALLTTALAGAWLLNATGQRPAARLFGLATFGLVALAVGGMLNQTLGRFDTPTLFVPGLLFGVPLAACAVERAWQQLRARIGRWAPIALTGVSAATAILLASSPSGSLLTDRLTCTQPVVIGLSLEQESLIETVRDQTTAQARILWEDIPARDTTTRWTPLLPLLTGRSFLGGLDPDGLIEHTTGGLRADALAGRPLAEWTDQQLDGYAHSRNIGWIVCWSPETIARLQRWPSAEHTLALGDDQRGQLFTLRRPHSFILKGKARWISAEVGRIALADVEPDENGELVLSLHYLSGLTATPNRVRIEPEREFDPHAAIPLVRLHVDAPVARLTLTWGN